MEFLTDGNGYMKRCMNSIPRRFGDQVVTKPSIYYAYHNYSAGYNLSNTLGNSDANTAIYFSVAERWLVVSGTTLVCLPPRSLDKFL
jgi:hypothetical protein